MSEHPFPCPCCGYLVFHKGPGSHGICPVCLWQDDLVQLRYVTMAGGANRVSLVDAQHNYDTIGASEPSRVGRTESSEPYPEDPDWRPINLSLDNFEPWETPRELRAEWPKDFTVLYYWKDNYWRKN